MLCASTADESGPSTSDDYIQQDDASQYSQSPAGPARSFSRTHTDQVSVRQRDPIPNNKIKIPKKIALIHL